MYLDYQHFTGIIRRHDKFNLRQWRSMFAGIADQLADFYINKGGYPFSKRFTEATIKKVFESGPKNKGLFYRGGATGSTIYKPWDGWWTGNWFSAGSTTGIPQFHIWDQTSKRNQRYFQLVSQSTKGFAHSRNWDEFQSRDHNQAKRGKKWLDLALNVYDGQNGITGWVTKKGMDLPHVGYLVDQKTLLWITWAGGKYYLFDEQASQNQYQINGRPFIYNTPGGFQGFTETHRGTYQGKQPVW